MVQNRSGKLLLLAYIDALIILNFLYYSLDFPQSAQEESYTKYEFIMNPKFGCLLSIA